MQNKELIKKSLSVAVIGLLVGVVFAPTLTADIKNDKKEMCVQICGLGFFQENKVILTAEEYQWLQQLLKHFQDNINKTEDRSDALLLFNELTESLYELGLFNGLTLDQCKMVVEGEHFNNDRLRNVVNAKINIMDLNNTNYLCLLTGVTSNTFLWGPMLSVLNLLQFIPRVGEQLAGFFLMYALILDIIFGTIIFPLQIGGTLTFSKTIEPWDPHEQPKTYRAKGWVKSFGLTGFRSWNGTLFGQLPLPIILLVGWFYTGAIVFSGIKVGDFFLGSSFKVSIDNKFPS